MTLSELAVRRPLGALVLNLLLVVFGLVALDRLAVREAPDINPPVVTVRTTYTGASAAVMEARVSRIVEDHLAGIEAIKSLSSASTDGRSTVRVEFDPGRDIDAAANDVRDRVNRALRDLPDGIDAPEVAKVDDNADEMMWLSLRSDSLDPMALSDLADRLVVDRLTAIDGVGRVNLGGERRPALRVWLDRTAMAARGVTAGDVEEALRRENLELPAGRLESATRTVTMRMERVYADPDAFARLPVATRDGATVRLGEVALVEVAPAEPNVLFRANGRNTVGLGIVAQSRANVLEVSRAVRAELDRIVAELPGGLSIGVSYDSSLFVENALREVLITLTIAVVLVVAVILLFLGSGRATLIPALTIPVSLIGGLAAVHLFGFSINILTLLAFVLATGLVVDDAIVVLENIWRRIERGEPPAEAAARGGRQVFFAVVATSAVLVAVFAPIGLQQGDTGRLFVEFALTIAGTVVVSSVAALTLVPALSVWLLRRRAAPGRVQRAVDRGFGGLERGYRRVVTAMVDRRALALAGFAGIAALAVVAYRALPQELVPPEDRGGLFVLLDTGPGTGFDYAAGYLDVLERALLAHVEEGTVANVLAVAGGWRPEPRAIVALSDWRDRDVSQQELVAELSAFVRSLPGTSGFARGRPSLGRQGGGRPVQFVIGGPSYEDLAVWRDRILERAGENPGLVGLDSDYEERRPQLAVAVDRERAAELGVPVQAVGATLQTLFGSRTVTTFLDRGEEYDVILQLRPGDRAAPRDLDNVYVRSAATGAAIPLSNLVALTEEAGPDRLNRFNRMRSVTISAGLAPGYSLGEALEYLQALAREELPAASARLDTRGEAREFLETRAEGVYTFALALLIAFLVLTAQFESLRLPVGIMLTVPLAVTGALAGLWAAGMSLNLYSQIGLIMLVGIAAKNGILMLEFASRLEEEEGLDPRSAAIEAAAVRLRPVLMTALSTAAGAVPLVISTGAGSEARAVIGVVILAGIGLATVLTLLLLPAVYTMLRPRRAGRVPASSVRPAE
ncbi:efflux RND transporter permease subunit [Azospirillum halopraeferens]|uniref:efflux RND transporter permease subunit n=1 Tax=Azospirillum halopraeferens TaxID=34010 RepID=UPI00041DF732|nr:efflux RND transporter permease subunit [Azospirillum halopraeferens]